MVILPAFGASFGAFCASGGRRRARHGAQQLSWSVAARSWDKIVGLWLRRSTNRSGSSGTRWISYAGRRAEIVSLYELVFLEACGETPRKFADSTETP